MNDSLRRMVPPVTSKAESDSYSKVSKSDCNVLFPAAQSFWLTCYLRASRLLACIALVYFALKKSFRIKLDPALLLKTLFSEHVLLVMRQTDSGTFRFPRKLGECLLFSQRSWFYYNTCEILVEYIQRHLGHRTKVFHCLRFPLAKLGHLPLVQ